MRQEWRWEGKGLWKKCGGGRSCKFLTRFDKIIYFSNKYKKYRQTKQKKLLLNHWKTKF